MKKILLLIITISISSLSAKIYNINRSVPFKIVGKWKGIDQNKNKFQLEINGNRTIVLKNNNSKVLQYKKAVLVETDYDGKYGGQVFVKFYQKKLHRYKRLYTIRESHTWKYSFLGDFLYLVDIQNKYIDGKRTIVKTQYIFIKETKK